MSEAYELKTIKDVFDKIPLHKIEECMKEITALMLECKTVEAAMKGLAHATTGYADNADAVWPETINWIDDDKGEVKADFSINDIPMGTIEASA